VQRVVDGHELVALQLCNHERRQRGPGGAPAREEGAAVATHYSRG
jgi:hypothetical protein